MSQEEQVEQVANTEAMEDTNTEMTSSNEVAAEIKSEETSKPVTNGTSKPATNGKPAVNGKSNVNGKGSENGKLEPEHFRKVFIGSLSYSSTDDSLREHFSKYGELVDCVIMKESKTNKSRGFGFVTYTKSSMVDELMKHRPHRLDGRELETKRATPREDAGKPGAEASVKKLFVGAIKENITEDMLREYFGKYGKIETCVIMKDKESQKSRGFAFITFDDYDPVDKIVLEKFHTVNNLSVAVKKALPKELTNSNGNSNGMNVNGNMKHNGSNNHHNNNRQMNQNNKNQNKGNKNRQNNNNNNNNMNQMNNGFNHQNQRQQFNGYQNNNNYDYNNDNFNNSNGFNNFSNGYNNGSSGGNMGQMNNGMSGSNGMGDMPNMANFAMIAQKMLQAASAFSNQTMGNGSGVGGNGMNDFSMPFQQGLAQPPVNQRDNMGFNGNNVNGGFQRGGIQTPMSGNFNNGNQNFASDDFDNFDGFSNNRMNGNSMGMNGVGPVRPAINNRQVARANGPYPNAAGGRRGNK